ncbi:integral membrane protein [Rhodococcus pyridinivorans AK37]|uniref:Integral membrane protein n=1 Tax=Rhodococcus pyridinivorans AK37 TaxID=1114960 RepID=H0JM87_9NOCA|nr:integral membrane protein [Rhodococcus pyridinivorans AK37]
MAPPAAYPGRVLIVAVLLFVLALVVGAVGVAALTGKLPRNRWAGVRTPDALRDDEAFALANKVAAPSMLGSAVLLALGGVASLTLPTVAGIIAVVVTVVAALITAGAGGSVAARVAAATKPEETAGCGTSCGACSLRGACEPTA